MPRATVLGNRTFLLLLSGNTASHIGLHGARLAYPLLVLMLTDSPVAASWVAFASVAPSIVFELAAGVVADFWERRRVLILCERMGLAACLLAVAVIFLRPAGLTLLLTLAAFVEGVASVFFNTSQLGFVRDVISEEEQPAAFAFLEAQQPISNMVGRMLAAAALGLARNLPFLANAASYAFCLWTLSQIRSRGRAQPPEPRPARIWEWSLVSAGVRALWADRFARESILILATTNAIFEIFLLWISVRLRGDGHPMWVIGIVLGASGLGGMLGAAPGASRAERVSPRVVLAVMVWTWAALFLVVLLSSSPLITAIAWAGTGFVGVGGNVSMTLYRVRTFPPQLVGRVFAAYKLICRSGLAVGALLSGVLLSTLGPTVTGWILLAATVALARHARRIPDPGPPGPPTTKSAVELPPAAAGAGKPANWIAALSSRSRERQF